LVLPLISKPGP